MANRRDEELPTLFPKHSWAYGSYTTRIPEGLDFADKRKIEERLDTREEPEPELETQTTRVTRSQSRQNSPFDDAASLLSTSTSVQGWSYNPNISKEPTPLNAGKKQFHAETAIDGVRRRTRQSDAPVTPAPRNTRRRGTTPVVVEEVVPKRKPGRRKKQVDPVLDTPVEDPERKPVEAELPKEPTAEEETTKEPTRVQEFVQKLDPAAVRQKVQQLSHTSSLLARDFISTYHKPLQLLITAILSSLLFWITYQVITNTDIIPALKTATKNASLAMPALSIPSFKFGKYGRSSLPVFNDPRVDPETLEGLYDRLRETETYLYRITQLYQSGDIINKEMFADYSSRVQQDLETMQHWVGEAAEKHGVSLDGIQNRVSSVEQKIQNLPTVAATILDLQERVQSLKSGYESIAVNYRLLDDSVGKLKTVLPDEISANFDKKGRLLMTNDFWNSLKSKIKSEFSDIRSIGGTVSHDDVETAVSRGWDDWLKKNEAKVRPMLLRVVDDWQQQNTVLTKSQFIELMKRDYSALSQKIADMDDKLAGKIDRAASQLSALADVKISAQVSDLYKRVNYASPGNGALVNPWHTSPSYRRAGWRSRIPFFAARPRSAVSALTSWSEPGECFASPGNSGSLGILLAHPIFLSDVVVEHLPKSASLDITTAPRNFELWAKVDKVMLSHARRLSKRLFGESNGPEQFVLVARGTYDADDSSNHLQSFPISVDLRVLGVAPENVVFKWTSNHGNGDYTCLYRVRIAGHLANKESVEKRRRDYLAAGEDGDDEDIALGGDTPV